MSWVILLLLNNKVSGTNSDQNGISKIIYSNLWTRIGVVLLYIFIEKFLRNVNEIKCKKYLYINHIKLVLI